MRWTALLFLPLLLQAQTISKPANRYVGSEVCKTCHADVWVNFYKNPHYKSIALGRTAPDKADPAKTGCEGCHGPGLDHVLSIMLSHPSLLASSDSLVAPSDRGTGGNKAQIGAFSKFTPEQTLDTCLRCHSKDVSTANIRRSPHTEADVVCTNCHSIHKPATPKFLLAKVQKDLCYSCHPSERAQFEMPSKHRVNEGVVQCSDCHNPHGSSATTSRTGGSSAMLQPAFDNEEPCLKCHVDKRGPFVFEHASVRIEGCEACHVPHGSMNAKLLRRPVVFTMCLECHNGAGTFGRENAGVFLTSPTHNLLDPKYQHCTLCHVRIHGSNSDPTFLR